MHFCNARCLCLWAAHVVTSFWLLAVYVSVVRAQTTLLAPSTSVPEKSNFEAAKRSRPGQS